MLRYLAVLLFLSCSVSNAQKKQKPIDVKKIITYSDRTRGSIPDGIEWNVELVSTEDGEDTKREFYVKYKNNDSYVESTAPPKYKDESFLFKGRSLWYFKKGLRAPVSVSVRQKLSGIASNGDIASTNYSIDYHAQFVNMEKIDNDDCYHFTLKSKADDTTYDKINYWISKKTGLAVKAEFLSLEDKPLKSATFSYNNQLQYKKTKYPFISQMVIVDSKNQSNISTLNYSNPKVVKISESIFNINNLKR